MSEQFTLDQYNEAADFIGSHTRHQPSIGLVLGSGLGPSADQIEGADIIPYAEIPHFPVSTVVGHAGRLVIGKLAGATVCAMQGRFHFYEGYTMQQITLPVRVMKQIGIDTLILTNAAGGVNPSFKVGDLMLIEDHINFIGMSGNNPLVGTNLEAFGTRFPAMNQVYTKQLRGLAEQAAHTVGLQLRTGVYFGLSGPTFESPAEIRMLRILGADAVGMSTVPEATVAHHAGMNVLAISTITNLCIDTLDSIHAPSHEEVNEAGKLIVPKLSALLLASLQLFATQNVP